VRGEDADGIWQTHQLALDGVVQLVAEFVGGDADGSEQVGSPDVADEQGVASEDAVGDLVVGMLVHEDADGFRCVPRGVHDLQGDLAQGDPFAVRQ